MGQPIVPHLLRPSVAQRELTGSSERHTSGLRQLGVCHTDGCRDGGRVSHTPQFSPSARSTPPPLVVAPTPPARTPTSGTTAALAPIRPGPGGPLRPSQTWRIASYLVASLAVLLVLRAVQDRLAHEAIGAGTALLFGIGSAHCPPDCAHRNSPNHRRAASSRGTQWPPTSRHPPQADEGRANTDRPYPHSAVARSSP